MAIDSYLRVYRRTIDDPALETVFPDDRDLATWLRLSLEADAAWPASASLAVRDHLASIGNALAERYG